MDACIVDFDPGLPADPDARQIFEEIWAFVDERYGAFPAKTVDWLAVREEHAPSVGSTETLYEEHWRMALAISALGDGHTGLQSRLLCSSRSDGAAFGRPVSNVGACVERVDDGLLVYKTEAGSLFELGDEVIGFDGRTVDEALRDLNHQPRCWVSASTEAQAEASMVASIMSRAETDRVIRVRRAGSELDIPVQPSAEHSDLLDCDGRIAPDGMVSHVQGVSAKLLDSDVLYVQLATFGYQEGTSMVAEPTIEALRGLFQDASSHSGMILDLRSNPGGSPLVYMAMASWLFDTPTTLFRCQSKVGAGHDDHGPAWSMVSTPDDTLHFDKPMAVLTNPRSFSAADFTAAWVQLSDLVATVGAPSAGGFGNSISYEAVSYEDVSADLWLFYNDILCRDVDDNILEGHPTAVDVPASHDAESIGAGHDAVIAAAEGWVLSQSQP